MFRGRWLTWSEANRLLPNSPLVYFYLAQAHLKEGISTASWLLPSVRMNWM